MKFKSLILIGLFSIGTGAFASSVHQQKCMDLILQIEGSVTGYAAAACANYQSDFALRSLEAALRRYDQLMDKHVIAMGKINNAYAEKAFVNVVQRQGYIAEADFVTEVISQVQNDYQKQCVDNIPAVHYPEQLVMCGLTWTRPNE